MKAGMTRKSLVIAIAITVGGCAEQLAKHDATMNTINAEMEKAIEERAKKAMLPPLVVEMPRVEGAKPLDQRFDLNVNNAPASQVFMAIDRLSRIGKVSLTPIRPCEYRISIGGLLRR